MLIPHFWAEARIQNKLPSRQITVRRWGWSDTNQAEAQAMADQRAHEAMDRLLAGDDKLVRRELIETYGVEGGTPIREEVVSRHGNLVITRNTYGSLCLNAPNVFFADVDARLERFGRRFNLSGCLGLMALGVGLGLLLHSIALALSGMFILPMAILRIQNLINEKRRPLQEAKAKADALATVRAFASAHPSWHLRVYETPAGYRLLAMHDVFDPAGDAAKTAFDGLRADEIFVRLCAIQGCFRARVSPKPWRLAKQMPVSLPKSRWPYPLEQMPRRQQWVEAYNQQAPNYASCRFIEALGSSEIHPEAEAVRALHDEQCKALTELPLA